MQDVVFFSPIFFGAATNPGAAYKHEINSLPRWSRQRRLGKSGLDSFERTTTMSRMSDTTDNISNTAKEAQSDIAEKAGQIGKDLREMGSQARSAATHKYEELRDSASEYYEHGKERAREWEHSLEQYVQEKPLQAVLIAAGIGVALGLLWKRH